VNIRAGITGRSRTWEQLLQREGLPWTTIDVATGDGLAECSVVIVTRAMDAAGREMLVQYLRGGGAILSSALHVVGLGGTTVRKEDLRYLVAGSERKFASLRLMDLGVHGAIPREASHLWTPSNTRAVFAGPLLGGVAVLLPFDPVDVLADTRTANRAFYARHDRLPSERVSRVSRGELFQLCHHALEFLHHARSLPYVHLWYYPGERPNVLAFRIDTDGSPRADVDALYGVLRDAGVPGSWFLDVSSHESWLDHFAGFDGHEIALHCYRHRIDTDMQNQSADWHTGMSLLRKAGFDPAGVAAPFGAWTPELGRVIDGLGLEYSSEFSYAYDALPLYAESDGAALRTLQVPIHPVSTGSLRRAGFTGAQMSMYFRMAADALFARDLPLFFYHHPTHGNLDVIASLLEYVRSMGITGMRMDQTARWWTGRSMLKASFLLRGDTLSVAGSAAMQTAHVGLHVSFSPEEDALLSPGQEVDMRTLKRRRKALPEVPEDIRVIRDPDPRRAFSDLFVSLLRRLS
jgi:hypothetical protein